jgi:hypothetical protein
MVEMISTTSQIDNILNQVQAFIAAGLGFMTLS